MITWAEPNKELEDKQAQFESYQKEIEKEEAELNKIDSEIEPLMETNEKNEKEIKKLDEEIKKIEKEIEKSESSIAEKEIVLGNRIRELYKSGGQVSYLTAFFGAGSLSELLDRLSTTNRILEIDKDSITELAESQKELNVALEAVKKKKSEINKMNAETKRNLAQIDEKKKEYRAKIEEIEKKRSQFDEEFLAKLELELVNHQLAIINNENSSYDDLKSAINQLKAIRDNQLKSPTVIGKVNTAIDEGSATIEAIDHANSAATKAQTLLDIAYSYLGYPYVWGATGPGSFDCSGFTSYVYRQMGYEITRSTYSQIGQGTPVSYDAMIPGDVVFTNNNTHVGIYVGGGQYIHAANENLGVIVSSVTGFYAARRIF